MYVTCSVILIGGTGREHTRQFERYVPIQTQINHQATRDSRESSVISRHARRTRRHTVQAQHECSFYRSASHGHNAHRMSTRHSTRRNATPRAIQRQLHQWTMRAAKAIATKAIATKVIAAKAIAAKAIASNTMRQRQCGEDDHGEDDRGDDGRSDRGEDARGEGDRGEGDRYLCPAEGVKRSVMRKAAKAWLHTCTG